MTPLHAQPSDEHWLRDLGSRETLGGPHSLDRIRELLGLLGEPQLAFPALHVAGTRGKGSTCALAASALEQAGASVGLTTSPHLLDPRERIRLNGVMVDHARFSSLVARVRAEAEPLDCGYFEVMTAAAFLEFAERGVDVAVVEVGIGGRLDATNVVRPAATAITRLGLDHRDRLGTTRAAIAREKAGILKAGVPAVVAPNCAEALDAVAERAREVGAPLRVITEEDVRDAPPTSLPGRAQRENAAVAWALLSAAAPALPLVKLGRAVAERGFAAVRWRARLELLPAALDGVDLLLDVAHDPESVAALVEHAAETRVPAALVFTCLAGKDLGEMAAVLAGSPLAPSPVFVPALAGPRALDAGAVAAALRASGLAAESCRDVRDALARARAAATARSEGRPALVAAFGSFVLAGDVLRVLAGASSSPAP